MIRLAGMEEPPKGTEIPAAPGPSITDDAKPLKLRPGPVLEDMIQEVDKGGFAGLERRLEALILEDPDHTEFGRRISEYVGKYDDDAIVAYISNQRKGRNG